MRAESGLNKLVAFSAHHKYIIIIRMISMEQVLILDFDFRRISSRSSLTKAKKSLTFTY